MIPSIHLNSLYTTLGFKNSKMPADFSRVFACVELRSRWPDCIAYKGPVIVTVSTTPKNGRKSSVHRVFVVCPCCKTYVPFGRFHQHFLTKTCLQMATRPDFDWACECGVWMDICGHGPFYPMELEHQECTEGQGEQITCCTYHDEECPKCPSGSAAYELPSLKPWNQRYWASSEKLP